MKSIRTTMRNRVAALWMRLTGGQDIIVPFLMVLLLPTISGCLLGFEFRDNVIAHIPFAIVDHDNSSLSRELCEMIETNTTFDVKGYGQSDQDIKDGIESGRIVAGMIIPRDFAADMLAGKAPRILVVYDGAQMSASGAVKGKISEILGTIRSGYLLQVMEGSLNMTPAEAQVYLQPISFTSRFLGNPTKNTVYFYLQGILANMVQISVFILGLEVTRPRERALGRLLRNGLFCGAVGTVSMLVVIGILKWGVGFPLKGSVITVLVMTFLNMTGIANIGILVRTFIENKRVAIECSILIVAMLLLSGYTYPVIAMPGIFQAVAPFVPFTYYGLTLRDVALLGTTFQQALPSIWWLTRFMLFTWLLFLLLCKSAGVYHKIMRAVSARKEKEAEV